MLQNLSCHTMHQRAPTHHNQIYHEPDRLNTQSEKTTKGKFDF